ncbi:MAG: DUF6687 family protein [Planctomycetota bacterium]
MDLPLVYCEHPGERHLLVVDGVLPGSAASLSHWPGNGTPDAWRHALSTGIAMNFVAAPAAEQRAFLAGIDGVANNHYDTDGVLALFTLYHPGLALAHRARLERWATAGDYFRVPDEEAFLADALITAYADPARSPIAASLAGLQDSERYLAATRALFARIPEWLQSGIGDEAQAGRPALECLRRDQEVLRSASAVPLVHLDLMVFELPQGNAELPGRHALFEAADCDRALLFAPGPGGVRTRLCFSTRSWFDAPGRHALPRPDFAPLLLTLNREEGVAASDEFAWRAQNPASASPELWFGRAGLPLFESHSDAWLVPSGLGIERIKGAILETLRDAWVFDKEDDTTDLEDIFAV